MQKLAKAALGFGALIPIGSAVGIGVYIAIRLILADMASGATSPDPYRVLVTNNPFELEDLAVLGAVLGFVVLVQLGTAVALSVHAASDPRLGNTGRVLWIVGFFFIGILALPAYFFVFVLRDPPPKRDASLERPPIAARAGSV